MAGHARRIGGCFESLEREWMTDSSVMDTTSPITLLEVSPGTKQRWARALSALHDARNWGRCALDHVIYATRSEALAR